MREIKFRAWQKWHEYMFTPDYIDFINGNVIIGEHDGDSRYEDIPLMQYTGKKDKNGKEIYEGDVVSIEYGKGIVEFSEKQAMFIINWIGDNESYNESLAYNPRNYIYGKTRKDIVVIGNIYENSEILKH